MKIGNNVLISLFVKIIATGLEPEDFVGGYKQHVYAPITIGNNVWLATNVTILKEVTICDNAIVASGAVVTKDITTPFAVYGGIAAKLIKIFDDKNIGG